MVRNSRVILGGRARREAFLRAPPLEPLSPANLPVPLSPSFWPVDRAACRDTGDVHDLIFQQISAALKRSRTLVQQHDKFNEPCNLQD